MTKSVLAIASGGGHWQQLMLMLPAFEGCDVGFATTIMGLPEQFGVCPFDIVSDCNRDKKLAVLRTAVSLFRIIWRTRPDVVISTGALPGVIGLAIGRMLGAQTIWVDSVANAEEMSMSGKMAKPFADLWLSQWEDVAREVGAEYAGSIL